MLCQKKKNYNCELHSLSCLCDGFVSSYIEYLKQIMPCHVKMSIRDRYGFTEKQAKNVGLTIKSVIICSFFQKAKDQFNLKKKLRFCQMQNTGVVSIITKNSFCFENIRQTDGNFLMNGIFNYQKMSLQDVNSFN